MLDCKALSLSLHPNNNQNRKKMYLTPEVKQNLFEKHGANKATTDTGSAESQIALFTHRINHLTEHLKSQKKDHSTRLSLKKQAGKRRAFLDYLPKIDIAR
jgi:small subunit ribosomal protein S15